MEAIQERGWRIDAITRNAAMNLAFDLTMMMMFSYETMLFVVCVCLKILNAKIVNDGVDGGIIVEWCAIFVIDVRTGNESLQ